MNTKSFIKHCIVEVTGETTCQKCKGAGYYHMSFPDKTGRGGSHTQIVPCDFPGCHNGIIDREENRRAQGLIPHGPGCGCGLDEAKLRCTICGGNAKGKQWWNQDKGQGICGACAAKMKARGQEDIEQSYGKEGEHYHLPEGFANIRASSPRHSTENPHAQHEAQTSKASDFIKECLIEVLTENLTEGFDPLSNAGPNSPQENPYPIWNNKMRNLEESEPTPELSDPTGKPYASKNTDAKDYIPTISIIKWAVQYLGKPEFESRVTQLLAKANVSSEEKVAHCIEFVAREALNQRKMQPVNEQSLPQSTSINWKCPHCSGVTKILLEIESPADYISCSECDHCGKEINDPYLDNRIYEEVISQFASRKILK
jgi:hypothetical protein